MRSPAPPPPTRAQRPDWISAGQWATLPAMLRAALIGSTVADSTVQGLSPYLSRLIAMRYAREIAVLIAAAEPGTGPTTTAVAASSEDHDPPLIVEGACS